MTTRVQVLRSSTTGTIPAAGTRLAGELWTNFPDLQIGVIDVAKNAQKLVGVRFFSTTANYAIGDFVVQAGKLYVATVAVTAGTFNVANWSQIAALTDIPAQYVLPTASTTVLGGVKIDGTSIAINSGVISYSLPTASTTVLGGVKIDGSTVTIASGVISVPGAVASSTPPFMDGTVAVGTGTTYARADHVHPSDTSRLALAGGTMIGAMVLAADPTLPLHPVTKQYADARSGINPNRLINGDMWIDQRNNGTNTTAIGYLVDRWQYYSAKTGQFNFQRTSVASTLNATRFAYALTITNTSAYTAAASDIFEVFQPIEADTVSDFAWGTAAAQPVTLSFWAISSLTGTFSGSIMNGVSNRSYPFTYALPVASQWTKISVTIPGDTGGTWVMSGNAAGINVTFDLGTGTTYRGPANAWASATYIGATGTVNLAATAGAVLQLTGVKLELGSVATAFPQQSLTKSLADCQRYYCARTGINMLTYGTAATTFGYSVPFPVTMRATPTVLLFSITYSNSSGLTQGPGQLDSVFLYATVTATGGAQWTTGFVANAEL